MYVKHCTDRAFTFTLILVPVTLWIARKKGAVCIAWCVVLEPRDCLCVCVCGYESNHHNPGAHKPFTLAHHAPQSHVTTCTKRHMVFSCFPVTSVEENRRLSAPVPSGMSECRHLVSRMRSSDFASIPVLTLFGVNLRNQPNGRHQTVAVFLWLFFVCHFLEKRSDVPRCRQ